MPEQYTDTASVLTALRGPIKGVSSSMGAIGYKGTRVQGHGWAQPSITVVRPSLWTQGFNPHTVTLAGELGILLRDSVPETPTGVSGRDAASLSLASLFDDSYCMSVGAWAKMSQVLANVGLSAAPVLGKIDCRGIGLLMAGAGDPLPLADAQVTASHDGAIRYSVGDSSQILQPGYLFEPNGAIRVFANQVPINHEDGTAGSLQDDITLPDGTMIPESVWRETVEKRFKNGVWKELAGHLENNELTSAVQLIRSEIASVIEGEYSKSGKSLSTVTEVE